MEHRANFSLLLINRLIRFTYQLEYISQRIYMMTLKWLSFLMLCGIALADEVCYEYLGCFADDWPFFSQLRPVRHLPWSPEEIGTKFLLFTRRNQYAEQVLSYDDPHSITNSHYRAWKKTKVIVHGFNSDGDSEWVPAMKNAILNVDDVNVIVVDWKNGADPLIYGQAATNTRVVGAQIGYLILVMNGYTGCIAEDFHIAGHSLGSHAAGYAGEWLSDNAIMTLGRITGMDAAGPYFEGTPAQVRLDPGDAAFVDAIHTNADKLRNLGWGMFDPVGHADFYPNGGFYQPGCPKSEVDTGAWWKISCSHSRAHQLFTDSIVNRDVPMYGHMCKDYATYVSGSCNDCPAGGCPAMGYYSDLKTDSSSKNIYYLSTGSVEPYGLV